MNSQTIKVAMFTSNLPAIIFALIQARARNPDVVTYRHRNAVYDVFLRRIQMFVGFAQHIGQLSPHHLGNLVQTPIESTLAQHPAYVSMLHQHLPCLFKATSKKLRRHKRDCHHFSSRHFYLSIIAVFNSLQQFQIQTKRQAGDIIVANDAYKCRPNHQASE